MQSALRIRIAQDKSTATGVDEWEDRLLLVRVNNWIIFSFREDEDQRITCYYFNPNTLSFNYEKVVQNVQSNILWR